MDRAIITPSDQLLPEYREMLNASSVVVVSGQPLRRVHPDGKEQFFDDCDHMFDETITVRSALIRTIPQIGHNHLHPKYHGEYPVLTGYTDGGVYVQIGTKACFGFSMALAK